MKQETKILLIVIGSVLGILLVGLLGANVSYHNSAADAEVLVIQAKDNCASTYDNGLTSIIQMAQVDANTKQFLINAVRGGDATQKKQVQQAYGEFVNGNPSQLMLLLGSIGNTNFTATAENVQREISAQRNSMLTCSKQLNSTQAELKNILGMDASGRVVKWPQTWLGMSASSVADSSLQDNDFDGRLTALDYRPPVNVNIRDAFGTGEGLPDINLYPTP